MQTMAIFNQIYGYLFMCLLIIILTITHTSLASTISPMNSTGANNESTSGAGNATPSFPITTANNSASITSQPSMSVNGTTGSDQSFPGSNTTLLAEQSTVPSAAPNVTGSSVTDQMTGNYSITVPSNTTMPGNGSTLAFYSSTAPPSNMTTAMMNSSMSPVDNATYQMTSHSMNSSMIMGDSTTVTPLNATSAVNGTGPTVPSPENMTTTVYESTQMNGTKDSMQTTVPTVNVTASMNDSTTSNMTSMPVNATDVVTTPGPENVTTPFNESTTMFQNATEKQDMNETTVVYASTTVNVTVLVNGSTTPPLMNSTTIQQSTLPANVTTMGNVTSSMNASMTTDSSMTTQPGLSTDAPVNMTATVSSPEMNTTFQSSTDGPTPASNATSAVPDSTSQSATSTDSGSVTPSPDVNTTSQPISSSEATEDVATPSTTLAPTSTESGSSSDPGTTVASTVPTTPQPTKFPAKQPDKPFILPIKVSMGSNDSDIVCVMNCSEPSLLQLFTAAFADVPGFLYVRIKEMPSQRRKRDTDMTIEVILDSATISLVSADDRHTIFQNALKALNDTAQINVSSPQQLASTLATSTGDVCQIDKVCPLGYRCHTGPPARCLHLCEDLDCGQHGTCTVDVDTAGLAKSSCVCSSDSEKTYSGPNCEDSEISKTKIIVVVAAVLGTVCALLLLVLLIICCRRTCKKLSDNKYEMTDGLSNGGYSDINMDKL